MDRRPCLGQRRPDGSYNIELSHSPEQIWDDDNGERYLIFGTNPTIDLVCVRALFNATVDAATRLECDTDTTQKWQEILANLPQNPTLNGVLIDEMLVQLHNGTIFLFPGVPKGKSASFTKLRLKGNVLVSAQRDGNTVRYAEIMAQSKQMTLRLQNPWPAGTVVEANGKTTNDPACSRIDMNLQPGLPVRINPFQA